MARSSLALKIGVRHGVLAAEEDGGEAAFLLEGMDELTHHHVDTDGVAQAYHAAGRVPLGEHEEVL